MLSPLHFFWPGSFKGGQCQLSSNETLQCQLSSLFQRHAFDTQPPSSHGVLAQWGGHWVLLDTAKPNISMPPSSGVEVWQVARLITSFAMQAFNHKEYDKCFLASEENASQPKGFKNLPSPPPEVSIQSHLQVTFGLFGGQATCGH